MSDAHIDPSSLHLRKELSALRRAWFLRDPATSSSWRSPLSSRSVAAAYSWNYGNGTKGGSNAANSSSRSFEHESSLHSRSENNQKKVFLYNWRQQSTKSIDNKVKLDSDQLQELITTSPEGSSSDVQKGESKSDTYLEGPITVLQVRGTDSETPTGRLTRKFKNSSISSKKYFVRNSPISEQLDLPSSSLRALSVGQSDDTEYCKSEDLQLSGHNFRQKGGYTSRVESSLLSQYENWIHSSKTLIKTRKEDSSNSYTPVSSSSYNRYGGRCPSTPGSWDGNTLSRDGDEVDQLDLLGQQGCGIPCYWSKRTKHGGKSCSPSLSDTLRRTGSSILCGSQRRYHKRRSMTSNKRRSISKSVHSLPLLSNSGTGGELSIDTASEELSTNFDEADLEASSRLDGRRSFRSQEGLELALTVPNDKATDHRSLSQKYRPRSFHELVGQNIVVQSLVSAISKVRIATVYLFHGPHGTGKASTARVFAAALNCLATEEVKPCGFCRECTDFASEKSMNIIEVDSSSKKGIDKVRHILKNIRGGQQFARYKVFIISKCHILPFKAWLAFQKFLEEPQSRVVFIFITTDLDTLPEAVASRCHKYLFPKIKDADIVMRLKKLSAEENLDVELDALDLIASNADGSLHDAEMMLDQLSLLGKRINMALVNDLVGIVPDEKLLDLLELAMSSDTAETVKCARELLDSGIDPMALMSQLAGLIMDIIAGNRQSDDAKCSGAFFDGRSLTESETVRLKRALKILSEAEKQLRVSSERSTWFTAALLELGSGHSTDPSYSSNNGKESHDTMKEVAMGTDASAYGKKSEDSHMPWRSSSASMLRIVNECDSCPGGPSSSMLTIEGSALATACKDIAASKRVLGCVSVDKLDEIWRSCIDRCHSKTLRQLLSTYAKLALISEGKGVLIAYIAFGNEDIKSRAERFLSSITNAFEIVLRHNVEVRMGLMADGENSVNQVQSVKLPNFIAQRQKGAIELKDRDGNADCNRFGSSLHQGLHKEPVKQHRKSFNGYEGLLRRTLDSSDGSPALHQTFPMSSLPIFSGGSKLVSSNKERLQENPMQRIHGTIESARLHAMEKATPGSMNRLKPERNQVLPRDREDEMASRMALAVSSKLWEEDLSHEIKAMEFSDSQSDQKDRLSRYAMSPSLLHSNSLKANFDKESQGYESGPGCNGLLCWKATKPPKALKVNQGTHIRQNKTSRSSLFGQCWKAKTPDYRSRR